MPAVAVPRRCRSDGDGQPTPNSRGTLGRRRRRAAERTRLAAELEAAERARRERTAALAREKALDALSARGEVPWRDVEALASSKRPDDYDRAVTLLTDLRAVAERAGSGDDFDRRIDAIRLRHARKWSFLDRLGRAGLIHGDR